MAGNKQRAFVADFRNDWIAIMRDILEDARISYASDLSDEQVSFVFWSTMLRRIDPKPRKVRRASGLACPAPLEAGLDVLTLELEQGRDVNSHVCRTRADADDANFHDGLLNDWNVQHFHLGQDGAQNEECLFAVVTDDAVYQLGVFGRGGYTETTLVQSIHDNWPELIASVKTSVPPSSAPPDPAKKQLKPTPRSLIQVADGTVYRSVGGGVTSARIGGSIVHHSDNAFDKISAWQRWFDQMAPQRLPSMKAQGIKFGDPPTFLLALEPGNQFSAVEHTAEVRIPLGTLAI